MTFELSRQVGAVTRAVENRAHEGRPARAVVASRTYDTTVEDLWDALTSRERIPRWFLPISGDLRLGGRYQLDGNAGGTITRCEPPRAVGMTWEYGGQVSWVEVRLSPVGTTRAQLELEHIALVPDRTWDEFGPGATGVGWDMALAGLAKHIETRASNDPREAMAWLGSDDGKKFVHLSSDDWRRAAVAAGTDAETASARAARTTAAYTGGSTAGASGETPG